MVSQSVLVTNKTGIHARPAAKFVQTVNKFKSTVTISKNEKMGNAKSLMSILSLSISKGSYITISVNGEDEVEALEKLVNLIETKFEEE